MTELNRTVSNDKLRQSFTDEYFLDAVEGELPLFHPDDLPLNWFYETIDRFRESLKKQQELRTACKAYLDWWDSPARAAIFAVNSEEYLQRIKTALEA